MTRSPKKVCSRIGIALLAMMLTWIVLTVVLSIILGMVAPGFLEGDWGVWLLNDVPLYLVALPVFLLILRTVPDGMEPPREKSKLGPGRFVLLILFCLGSMYAFNILSSVIILLLQQLTGSGYVDSLTEMANTGGYLQIVLFGAVVPALGEEFAFRYMIRKKMKGCGDKTYILFSAFCFSLFHANLAQIFYAFAIGVVFALVYLKTDNIWLPVSMHFIINLLGMAVVPGLMELGDVAVVAVMLGLLALIVLALVLLLLNVKKVVASLYPPYEPGWPYKQLPSNAWEQQMQPHGAPLQQPPAWQQPAQAYNAYPPARYVGVQPSYYDTQQPHVTQRQPYGAAGPYSGYGGQQPYENAGAYGGYTGQYMPGAQPPAAVPDDGYLRPPPVRHSQYEPPRPAANPYADPSQLYSHGVAPYGQNVYQAPYQNQPYAGQPHPNQLYPYGSGQPWQQGGQPPYYGASYGTGYPQAYAPKPPGGIKLCIGNVGMILYICLTGIMTLLAII